MQNIAQKLLRGSVEIDRMRAEIKSVVYMICGFVMFHDDFCLDDTVSIKAGKVTWEILHNRGSSKVFAHVNYPGGSCGSGVIDSIPLCEVAMVHASLDGFVRGATKSFPLLINRIQPILDAAPKS